MPLKRYRLTQADLSESKNPFIQQVAKHGFRLERQNKSTVIGVDVFRQSLVIKVGDEVINHELPNLNEAKGDNDSRNSLVKNKVIALGNEKHIATYDTVEREYAQPCRSFLKSAYDVLADNTTDGAIVNATSVISINTGPTNGQIVSIVNSIEIPGIGIIDCPGTTMTWSLVDVAREKIIAENQLEINELNKKSQACEKNQEIIKASCQRKIRQIQEETADDKTSHITRYELTEIAVTSPLLNDILMARGSRQEILRLHKLKTLCDDYLQECQKQLEQLLETHLLDIYIEYNNYCTFTRDNSMVINTVFDVEKFMADKTKSGVGHSEIDAIIIQYNQMQALKDKLECAKTPIPVKINNFKQEFNHKKDKLEDPNNTKKMRIIMSIVTLGMYYIYKKYFWDHKKVAQLQVLADIVSENPTQTTLKRR